MAGPQGKKKVDDENKKEKDETDQSEKQDDQKDQSDKKVETNDKAQNEAEVSKDDLKRTDKLADKEKQHSENKPMLTEVAKQLLSEVNIWDEIGRISVVTEMQRDISPNISTNYQERAKPGMIDFTVTESLPNRWSTFLTGDSRDVWFKRDLARKINFNSYESFVTGSWEVIKEYFLESFAVLKCPQSESKIGVRAPDPSKLGYPIEQLVLLHRDIAIVQQAIFALVNKVDRPDNSLLTDLRTMDSEVRSRINNSFINYVVDGTMDMIRNNMVVVYSIEVGQSTPMMQLPRISHNRNWCHPIANPFDANLVFLRLRMANELSFDLTNNCIMPKIRVRTQPMVSMLRQAKPGAAIFALLNNIVSTNYDDSMNYEFAAIMSAWITPSQIKLTVDWSEEPEENKDINAFIASIIKCLLMRNLQSVDNNIESDSIFSVENKIVDFLINSDLVAFIPGNDPNAYPDLDTDERKLKVSVMNTLIKKLDFADLKHIPILALTYLKAHLALFSPYISSEDHRIWSGNENFEDTSLLISTYLHSWK